MGLREQQQDERRERILAAARGLIRKGGAEALQMRSLASEAGVGLVTPYNLFGGKGGVLHALLEESVDAIEARIAALPTQNPIRRAFAMMECAVDQYIEDPEFHRALMRALWEQNDRERIPQVWERCIAGLAEVLAQARREGFLDRRVRPDLLSRHQFFDHMIALEAWSNGYLDDDGFRAHCRYGLALGLAGTAGERGARRRGVEFLDAQRQLEAALGRGLSTDRGAPDVGSAR